MSGRRQVPPSSHGLVELRLPETELIAIDNWIEADAPHMSRPDAVRHLMLEGLTHAARPRMARVPVVKRKAKKPHLPKAKAGE